MPIFSSDYAGFIGFSGSTNLDIGVVWQTQIGIGLSPTGKRRDCRSSTVDGLPTKPKGPEGRGQGIQGISDNGHLGPGRRRARIDPTLEAGSAAETVEANPETRPELKTDCADVATVFD